MLIPTPQQYESTQGTTCPARLLLLLLEPPGPGQEPLAGAQITAPPARSQRCLTWRLLLLLLRPRPQRRPPRRRAERALPCAGRDCASRVLLGGWRGRRARGGRVLLRLGPVGLRWGAAGVCNRRLTGILQVGKQGIKQLALARPWQELPPGEGIHTTLHICGRPSVDWPEWQRWVVLTSVTVLTSASCKWVQGIRQLACMEAWAGGGAKDKAPYGSCR